MMQMYSLITYQTLISKEQENPVFHGIKLYSTTIYFHIVIIKFSKIIIILLGLMYN